MKALILASSPKSLVSFRGQLILDLIERGYKVTASAPNLLSDAPSSSWLIEKGVEVLDAPFSRTGTNPLADCIALFKLIRLMRRVNPDLFLAYTIKPVIWGGIAARIAGVANRFALITGLGYAFTGQAQGKRKLIQGIAGQLYKISLAGMQLIFFQNRDDRDDFNRFNILPKNIPTAIVNGSGVDTNFYALTELPKRPVKFLLIARLLGDKGIREYVGAARIVKRKYPETEFHLVGGLDENPDAIKAAEVNSWADENIVSWHGQQNDVRPFISQSHVYVLPSYREGTPRSVLEAMSMGRAIITTDAPGCRETVAHGENGLLVKPGSTESLAEAMFRMIQDDSLIPLMGSASRKYAEEKYDVHKVNEFMLHRVLSEFKS